MVNNPLSALPLMNIVFVCGCDTMTDAWDRSRFALISDRLSCFDAHNVTVGPVPSVAGVAGHGTNELFKLAVQILYALGSAIAEPQMELTSWPGDPRKAWLLSHRHSVTFWKFIRGDHSHAHLCTMPAC